MQIVPPIEQWKGHDPVSGAYLYYKVDQAGFIVERFNPSTNSWDHYTASGPFPKPEDLERALGTAERDAIATEMLKTGLFKPKTEYILIGDEPQGGSGVVDLKSMLSIDDMASMKKFLSVMPRSMLYDWFMKKVWPSLPETYVHMEAINVYGGTRRMKQFETLVWAAFIDLFNQANLEHVNKNQMEPWTWEEEKLEAYYLSTSKEAIAELEQEISSFGDAALLSDPQSKSIMDQYQALPPIGDLGLEINRQNSIKELLKQKDYLTAQAIVDAFRYADDTIIGEAIKKPIPFDIVAADGSAEVLKS